jgi:3-methyladenine DNA glycosylase AlkD
VQTFQSFHRDVGIHGVYVGTAPATAAAALDAVRAELARAADPERAAGMQAYMKSAMPYYGVASPEQKRIYKSVFGANPLDGFEEWRDAVLTLWRGARHREERYAAIALAGARAYRCHQRPEMLAVYEEMIEAGAWWDYVDPVAIHLVGAQLLRRHPAGIKPAMLAWSTDAKLWKRRASIICQVGLKRETDLDLLYACIEPNLDDRDFFVRKAIGWALRQHAWTDPDEVRRYVAANASRLSGLSRREALKNLQS